MSQNTSEKLSRFISLLESIFELDKADLDFGIYRILNIRKDEIKRFLSADLPKKVQEALASFANETATITRRIGEIEKQAEDLGIEITTSPKLAEEYARLKSQLDSGTDLSSLETDVYSVLYSFFNRYYDEGDFISKRRYKEGVYAIPYEGEEVKLYWANADQYYIKTTENFRDYTFVDDGKKIHFRLVDATSEKNNNKESDANKRVFMLYTETPEKPELKTIEEIDGELIIRFIYDVPTDGRTAKQHAEENFAAVSEAIQNNHKSWLHLLAEVPTARNGSRTIIQKHLDAYVAKNTFDYFIHKDLRGFLTRELDFFIKSEVIHLDELDTTDEKRADCYLAKVRAIKRVGRIIIDFLSQIEEFQKKLWLKKKFVVSTNWCITLDRVDESFYPEIIANPEQIDEWKKMYAIEDIQRDLISPGYSEPLTTDFLRWNGNLVLDTRHFSADFKDRLIASIEDLDEQTGGLLIHSENFQALRLLTEKYRGQIKCVYIDPPYNTGSDGFIYRDSYQHSSWMSFIYDRIKSLYFLIKEDGLFFSSIDFIEEARLRIICDEIFYDENFLAKIVWEKRFTRSNNAKLMSTLTENLLAYRKSDSVSLLREKRNEKSDSTYSNPDNDPRGPWTSVSYVNPASREARPNLVYPLTNPITSEEVVHPTNAWKYEQLTYQQHVKENRLYWGTEGGHTYPRLKKFLSEMEGMVPVDLWKQEDTGTTDAASRLLDDEFGYKAFDFPKPPSLIKRAIELSNFGRNDGLMLDCFAGSAPTGHAVLNLNRADNGTRKYILVEMGDYFNSVTLPRIKKVVYSADWKAGKPQNRSTGVSHIMKYFSLESYEDALSNIELEDERHNLYLRFGEEYLLHYMLDYEAKNSMLPLSSFDSPFEYRLRINENNETKEKVVDICETFNFLVGLSVVRQSPVVRFRAVADPKGEYEGAVRLERDESGEYAFKQIEGKMPDGKRALVIWRTVTEDLLQSNAALDAYFGKHRINPDDCEFDVLYVNGDNNLENLRLDDETWNVRRIEPVFKEKMFEEA